MPERYAPGLLALHATAACGGEDTPLQNGASRVRPKLITEGSPGAARAAAGPARDCRSDQRSGARLAQPGDRPLDSEQARAGRTRWAPLRFWGEGWGSGCGVMGLIGGLAMAAVP